MKKKMYTNVSLFHIIVEQLESKNLLPDHLDYHLADHNPIQIKTEEWNCLGDLRFGCSEGIYLDMYAEGRIGDDIKKVRLGTFKTLREDREAFHHMAKLMADFIWETTDFVNNHIDDFTWTGYDVDFYRNNKKTMRYSTSSEASAEHLVKRNYKYHWDYVVITNNENGKKFRVYKQNVGLN